MESLGEFSQQGKIMESYHRVVEELEVSEWLEWMKSDLPAGGIQLPCEEHSVLIACSSLRVAERLSRMYRHLPRNLLAQLVEALIVHQCWTYQKRAIEDGRRLTPPWPMIRGVEMESHVRKLEGHGQYHLMKGEDGFQYVVKFPNGPNGGKALVTEAICGEIGRLMGLSVPTTVIAIVGKRLVAESEALRIVVQGKLVECKHGPCLGSRFIDSSASTAYGVIPDNVRHSHGTFRQFMGSLVFDLWTLNFAPPKAVFLFDDLRNRFTTFFTDQSQCLAGNDWSRFVQCTYDEPLPARPAASALTRFNQVGAWISRAETVDTGRLWEMVFALPPEWYGSERSSLTHVADRLSQRQWHLRRIFWRFAERGYFPRLKDKPPECRPANPAA